VTKGLALNDRVVADGIDRLREGTKIRMLAKPVAAAPAADRESANTGAVRDGGAAEPAQPSQ